MTAIKYNKNKLANIVLANWSSGYIVMITNRSLKYENFNETLYICIQEDSQ